MEDYETSSAEISLADIVSALWDGKFLIAFSVIVFLVLGAAAYLTVPPRYQSTAEITPIRRAEFADYLSLTGAEVFPYNPASLLNEFGEYLRDLDHLISIAREIGIVEQGGMTDQQYLRALRSFASGIQFTTPEPAESEAQVVRAYLRMRVGHGDLDKLEQFVAEALTKASSDLAAAVRSEVSQRIAVETEIKIARIEQLKLDIEARREKLEADRKDGMERLAAQARIARSLDLDRPLEIQQLAQEPSGGATAQIMSGDGGRPDYLRGYVAIEEQIETLEQRQNNDPFIDDLRELEQQIYVLQNDPRPERLNALLASAQIGSPEGSGLVRYSLAAAAGAKVFPRLIVFAGGSLVLGLLFGVGVVVLRSVYAARRR